MQQEKMNFDAAKATLNGPDNNWYDLANAVQRFLKSRGVWAKEAEEFFAEKQKYFSYSNGVFRPATDAPSSVYNWLKSWVDKCYVLEIQLDIEPTVKMPVAVTSPEEQNPLVELDKWLGANPSRLQNHEMKVKVMLGEIYTWIDNLGEDFIDLLDMLDDCKKSLRGWTMTNQSKKLEIVKETVTLLGEVYLELTTDAVVSLRDKALASGSTKEEISTYINSLAKDKAISQAKKTELLSYFTYYKSQAVACLKLRTELKKM